MNDKTLGEPFRHANNRNLIVNKDIVSMVCHWQILFQQIILMALLFSSKTFKYRIWLETEL